MQYYLTTQRDTPQGDGYIAVITAGHPNGDAECTVCDVGRFVTVKAAEAWFLAQVRIEPWRTSDGDEVPL